MLKLTTVKSAHVQRANVAGLLTGDINFEIKGGTSNVQWTGPKIPPAVWVEILAFFKKTYEDTKSECQVRLYVNTITLTWAAWAYPQEAKSGMTAKEIDNPDATEQRKQFSDADGWFYLGTVHHHCMAAAFQSGTDHANERSQDGLHITVGKMDEKQHDIHARFYLAGCEFAPDMSAFWDVGDQLRELLPASALDLVARHQMTKPAPADAVVNEQWTKNLIDKNFRPAAVVNGAGTVANHGTSASVGTGRSGGINIDYMSAMQRREAALDAAIKSMRDEEYKTKAIEQIFMFLLNDPRFDLIRQAAALYQTSISEIVMEWEFCVEQEQAQGIGQ